MPTFPFFIPMMLVLLPLVAGPVFLSIYLIENHRRCVYWYKIFIVVYFSFFYVAVIFATLVYWIPFILFFGGSLCLGSLIYGFLISYKTLRQHRRAEKLYSNKEEIRKILLEDISPEQMRKFQSNEQAAKMKTNQIVKNNLVRDSIRSRLMEL